MSGIIAAFGIGLVVGGLLSYVIAGRAAKRIPSTTGAEVSDLIGRLRPLIRNTDLVGSYHGVEITFHEAGVNLVWRPAPGTEQRVSAASLREAVAMLAGPSPMVNEALQGWMPSATA